MTNFLTTLLIFLGVLFISSDVKAADLGRDTQLKNSLTKCGVGEEQAEITDELSYGGKLFDSHFHMPLPEDVGTRPVLGKEVSLKYIDCVLRTEGTKRAFSFFAVFPEYSTEQWLAVAASAAQKYPQRFVRFLMPPGPSDVPPTMRAIKIKKMLNEHQGLFQGYGEIGLYDLPNRSADDYPPDAKIFRKIYPLIRKHNLLVYFHPGENHADNLELVLQDNPDINFIVHGEQIENEIGELMGKYSNIYFTVNDLYGDQYLLRADGTKKEFMEGLSDFAPLLEFDLLKWRDLIEAHPNQFIWGTDRGDAVWTYDKEVGQKLAEYARAFIGRLNSSVQKKFAYQNAQKIWQN